MTITEIPHIERSEMNGDGNPEDNNHSRKLSWNCGHEIHGLVNQNVMKWLGDDGTGGKHTFHLTRDLISRDGSNSRFARNFRARLRNASGDGFR